MAERQKVIEKTRIIFNELYQQYFELLKNSETKELIVADGILLDRENNKICHPVLTHRVQLNYDADNNIITIHNTNVSSELYSDIFQSINDINLNVINILRDDLLKNDYHPLDRIDTPAFFNALVHQLSSESIFSENGIPEGWNKSNRLLLYRNPVFIVRKRLDGTLGAIEQIIKNIQENHIIPDPICDIVSGGKIDIPNDTEEESLEEQLASVGGESIDILLSKEANKEQLEIAKRIEHFNAVLVQGPPGTGKTHTIANLMGHFLAQGKSVLVTSYTTKALNVLKEKVYIGLQNLCVSVLDDSNIDMEKSIDGITGYMSKYTSFELKKDMERLAVERKDIINSLAAVRRKIFLIINRECNCIVYNGEDISPSKAAAFVLQHSQDLSYIPGKVKLNQPLPLTLEQLQQLYRSNEGVTIEDETELATNLPDVSELISPADFSQITERYNSALIQLEGIKNEQSWDIFQNEVSEKIEFTTNFGTFDIEEPTFDALTDLQNYVSSFSKIEKWMKTAAVDGKNGGQYRKKWEMLIEQIQKTRTYAEQIVTEQFGKNIEIHGIENLEELRKTLETLRELFEKKGKISKFSLMFHKECNIVLNNITINNNQLQSVDDCNMILHYIEMESIRKQCAIYWDALFSIHDIPKFFDLDSQNQENVAKNYVEDINRYLDWYAKDYKTLTEKIEKCGFPIEKIFSFNALDSELTATDKILFAIENILPELCTACAMLHELNQIKATLNTQKEIIISGKRGNSKLCLALYNAIEEKNSIKYAENYAAIDSMYSKYKLQKDRYTYLATLEPYAPQWADAIRRREGVHGEYNVPVTIEDAWKWKQFSGIIEEITVAPFQELQAESLRLSKEYRRITAEYAEKCGWYHLLKATETDIDMKQALQGWKQTVKRIGKGTGKNAPMYKAKARELMAKCQSAVPCWIMPINKALENLNPRVNRFDVVIIDEASQADISSLAILYMGKKLIIVGDDKQVSPLAVGAEVGKMNVLEEMYIKDKIPNSHLYNAKTSIYDIAATTFQPLMLREHFRCVPEIIGFSNMLSYDYKIKPLRDASNSVLLPAIVSYRVNNGQRNGRAKTNHNEACAIVALMKSCIEQDEYKNKTMGVISLLGNDQAKLIQRLVEQEIDSKEAYNRKIICGDSADFQGDERDVIFLSMVDSRDGDGPIHLQGFGVDDAIRKRYNVAASRAKDQLWVVHSLDSSNDLKPGDIRKTLLDYAKNPNAQDIKHKEIENQSESPFETDIATALVTRGYHLVQQWKVGAYRLDMVVMFNGKTVAIECDGERWHSGEAAVRADMERQTILERLGWRFIRIRGSEYYRQPNATIERVVNDLSKYGIEPEESSVIDSQSHQTDLSERVIHRTEIILNEQDEKKDDSNETLETITYALGSFEN